MIIKKNTKYIKSKAPTRIEALSGNSFSEDYQIAGNKSSTAATPFGVWCEKLLHNIGVSIIITDDSDEASPRLL